MSKTGLTIFQVDAFAERTFEGNPAAVVPLEAWLPDELLLKIAAENNLSETAYFVDQGDHYHLRWFTPAREVRLCGHATLASAHVLYHHLGYEGEQIRFKALGGDLSVSRNGNLYTLDFPADKLDLCDKKDEIERALRSSVLDVARGTDDLLARVDSEETLLSLNPDLAAIRKLDARGLIVTAPGTETDIASRCFFPAYGVDEDPVTGSAHTLLTPYWTRLLEQDSISAVQGKARKGFLRCRNLGDRVAISGPAQT
jgi:PhzF family phenazine biosynthesis protein